LSREIISLTIKRLKEDLNRFESRPGSSQLLPLEEVIKTNTAIISAIEAQAKTDVEVAHKLTAEYIENFPASQVIGKLMHELLQKNFAELRTSQELVHLKHDSFNAGCS